VGGAAVKKRDWKEAVRDFASRVRAVYGDRVEGVYVYGSRARGDARPDSDIDVAIVLRDRPLRFWRELERTGSIAFDYLVDDDLFIQPYPVSAVDYRAEEPDRPVIANIRKDGLPVEALR
jgi:predicted nucleotidyltransferase